MQLSKRVMNSTLGDLLLGYLENQNEADHLMDRKILTENWLRYRGSVTIRKGDEWTMTVRIVATELDKKNQTVIFTTNITDQNSGPVFLEMSIDDSLAESWAERNGEELPTLQNQDTVYIKFLSGFAIENHQVH